MSSGPTRISAALVLAAAFLIPARGHAADGFAGDWKSTFGEVSLKVAGDGVTGFFHPQKFPITGKISGDVLTFEYSEGQAKGSGKFTLEKSGNAFSGTFSINGNSGVWNGWRPDPKATSAQPADFRGLWLTEMGLLELEGEGAKLKGTYAFRGDSTIEGKVVGRRFEFTYQGFLPGSGWFDMNEKGDAFAGAADTQGRVGWYGWKGRKAAEYVRNVPLIAGKLVDGSTKNMLTYAIRAPESYKPESQKPLDAIVVLHGSNMNAQAYAGTFAAAWPEIAKDHLIIGINGETPSNIKAENPAFNFSYVNYVGKSKYQGFPGTDRESPALVRDALIELKSVYPIKRYFVGGHSQGGFLTYSLLMNSPELFAGAFPVSSGLIFQCEPTAYDNAELKALQRKVPLAIVHAKNDPIVNVSMSDYAYKRFADASWPALRFFRDDNAAHMFARLPVGEALRWLEAMSSDDPQALVDFAEKSLKEKRLRDAIAATHRLSGLSVNADLKPRVAKIASAIDAKAKSKLAGFTARLKAGQGGAWVDDFLAFRAEFEFAPSAARVMSAFNELRKKHEPAGEKLMGEANGLFREGKPAEGRAKLREIVEKAFASTYYANAKETAAQGN